MCLTPFHKAEFSVNAFVAEVRVEEADHEAIEVGVEVLLDQMDPSELLIAITSLQIIRIVTEWNQLAVQKRRK